MAVGEPFLAAARDDDPAAFDMEATWGLARASALATSPVPGTALHGAARALNGRAHAGVLAAGLGACNRYRCDEAALRALDMPTLVAVGRRDQMTPMKAGIALAAQIKGARVVTLDAGHSMMTEAPRELAAELRDFLRA